MISKGKPPVRSQSISVESERGASYFRLSEGSSCLHAACTGCCFYIQSGKVKKTVSLRAGEGSCGRASGNRRFLWGSVLDRTGAASVNRLRDDGMRDRANRKADITRVIHEEPAFAELFIAHLLVRNSRVEEDLVDQLFDSSEKRLARILLLLANFGKEEVGRSQ